jgi:hypothetical protein
VNDIPELPPSPRLRRPLPEGGFEAAVTAGRRRLRVRAATAASSAALVALGLLVVGSPSTRSDSLEQTANPTASASTSTDPEASATPPPGEPASPGGPTSGPGTSGTPEPEQSPGATSGAEPGGGEPEPTVAPPPPADGRPGFREPTDEDADGDALCTGTKQSGGASVCGYSDDSGPLLRRGSAFTALTGDCIGRQTLPVVYEFAGGQETELLVELNGREVFRFSRTVRYLDGAHERRLESGRCIEWSSSWRGVDNAGRPVPAGTYDVTFSVHYERSRIEGGPPPEELPENDGYSYSYDVTVVD